MSNVAVSSYDELISGKLVHLKYKYISEDNLKDLYHLFVLVFHYYDQIYLTEVVFTISKEILMNAVKANAKRLFFQRMNLDIENPNDYKKGMAIFSEEVTMQWNKQEEYLEGSSYYVIIRMVIKNGTFHFQVENNAPVLPQEQERIHARVEKAKTYNDLADAFMDFSDTTESAGLGIILTHILLKNSGIGYHNFKMEFSPKVTKVTLSIPNNVTPREFSSKFNEKILDEIENLPALPQNVTKLIELCNNPNSDITKIGAEIEKDPALSADLIKLSNSAFFITRNRANTVVAALKIVGIKNLKNLLYVTGVNKVLGNRYKKAEEVLEHSNKVSFFARSIALEFGKTRLADLASTSGLLHDIGKLILLSLGKEITEKIQSLKTREKTNSVIIEEYSVGISHAEVAGLLLEKWSFPEDLISVCRYHHKPFLAPEEHKEIVELIYLANMMVDFLDLKASFTTIYPESLKILKVDREDQFMEIVNKFNISYNSLPKL